MPEACVTGPARICRSPWPTRVAALITDLRSSASRLPYVWIAALSLPVEPDVKCRTAMSVSEQSASTGSGAVAASVSA